MCGISLQPLVDIVIVELFCPEHSGKSLTLDVSFIRRLDVALDVTIELICFLLPQYKQLIEVPKRVGREMVCKPQTERPRFARGDGKIVMECGLGAPVRIVKRFLISVDDEFIDPVFEVTSLAISVQSLCVSLIFTEQCLRLFVS